MTPLHLTDGEVLGIIRGLAPQVRDLAFKFDERKYPRDAYEALVRAFEDPMTTSGGDIRRALEWKYGHWGKAKYPQPHRDMAERIWSRWRAFCNHLPLDPQEIFDLWMKALRGRWTQPYITVTFLLHLMRPSEFPIIDQHTFRSMNWLIRQVRSDRETKKKAKNRPSNYDDLLSYTEFFNSLLAAWPPAGAVSRPDLDKALMVFGQRLKGRAVV